MYSVDKRHAYTIISEIMFAVKVFELISIHTEEPS